MALHDLKTWTEPFEATWDGRKTAEFRRDDRGFTVGDGLKLREFDPDTGNLSGRKILATITDIRRQGPFGIPKGYAMLSFQILGRIDVPQTMTPKGGF